jgi:hypothetical protein
MERVAAGRQAGVIRATARSRIDPAVIEAFETIAKLYAFGRRQAECRVLQFPLSSAGLHTHAVGERLHLAIDEQRFDDHRRSHAIARDDAGVNAHDATNAG